MGWAEELAVTVAAAPTDLLSIQKAIDPDWIEEALAATGKASLRKRRLPAEQVIWLVLGMALYRGRSIEEVAASLDIAWSGPRGPTVAASAIPQARERLGAAPLQWLFERTARHWAHAVADEHRWNGLRVYAMDGTTLRLHDTEENRTAFGGLSGQSASTHPIARLVALISPMARLVAAARIGPYSVGEQTLARSVWSEVPEHSVVVVDRNFHSTGVLIPFASEGDKHWLLRAKSTSSWKVLEELGPDDQLVEMRVSQRARDEQPDLPKTFIARVIGYEMPGHRRQHLITSMLDPKRFPAKEVVALYHARWEIELAFDEVKTDVLEREETLRSKKAEGVRQEIWGLLLAYNLVRLEMARIAKEAGVEPWRISFVTALSLIQNEWMWCAVASPGAIPRHLENLKRNVLRFVLPARRSSRAYPRAVKSRGLKYPRKKSNPLN